jgi:hypothetical protein
MHVTSLVRAALTPHVRASAREPGHEARASLFEPLDILEAGPPTRPAPTVQHATALALGTELLRRPSRTIRAALHAREDRREAAVRELAQHLHAFLERRERRAQVRCPTSRLMSPLHPQWTCPDFQAQRLLPPNLIAVSMPPSRRHAEALYTEARQLGYRISPVFEQGIFDVVFGEYLAILASIPAPADIWRAEGTIHFFTGLTHRVDQLFLDAVWHSGHETFRTRRAAIHATAARLGRWLARHHAAHGDLQLARRCARLYP